MEPRIQYAKTEDGVSIAYSAIGDGMPLVMATGPAGLLEPLPESRIFIERLAAKWQVVRFDHRGFGLSGRKVHDHSLDPLVRDLEAVVDRLGRERFALYGAFHGGPVAIKYAARHPERVSHLLLWCTWARGSAAYGSPHGQAVLALRKSDWEEYTEATARLLFASSDAEKAHRAAARMREGITREGWLAFTDAVREFDATDLLPDVKAPTLVLHRRQVRFPELESARDLVSGIQDARLVVLEGQSLLPAVGDIERVLSAIEDFLGEGKEAPAELPEGMAVLLFADIAESTALTEQLGDAAFRAKARELDTSLRSVIKDSGGTPVEGKVLGDGVLAVFTSARGAIDCALRCEAAGEPLGLQLHLGIHAGDVIREGNNVYGGAVNIAARIAAASEPGEVLVSDTVRSLGRTSADVTFDDRGEHELKGVGEPQRLFAVRGGG